MERGGTKACHLTPEAMVKMEGMSPDTGGCDEDGRHVFYLDALDEGMMCVPSSTEWDDSKRFIKLFRIACHLKWMNYF